MVLMILWHSADSWIAEDARTGLGWAALRFLGGMAAPSFLLLAGVGVGLKVAADHAAGKPARATRHALTIRGLEVVAYGYLLRLQFWAIDAGGFIVPGGYRAWVPLALGHGLLLWALAARSASWRGLLPWLSAAIGILVFGYAQLEAVTPGRLVRVLRVDVLQAIGVSIVLVAHTVSRIAARHRVAAGWLLALGACLLASYTHTVMPGPLHPSIAGYLGQWKVPAGQPYATLFPVLPWVAYAWVGASLAVLWRDAGTGLSRQMLLLAVAGVVVAVPSSENWPHVHVVMREAPLLVQPIRVAYRVAVLGVIAFAAYHVSAHATWLRRFGQSSLFVYWFHLEFTFGVIANPLKRTMNLWIWFVVFVLLTAVMYAIVVIRQGPLERALGALRVRWATRRAT